MRGDWRSTPPVGRYVCTGDEKERIWETVRKLLELGLAVRGKGLLYLEEAADREADVFFRSCLRYIAETAPTPEELREYVSIWLRISDLSNFRRLEMMVLADGLEQILKQRTPTAVLRRLGAWLGADDAGRIEEMADWGQEPWKGNRRKESLEPEFDTLLALSEESLRRLLEETGDHPLCLALMGAGDAVTERIRRAVSAARWNLLEDGMRRLAYPRACDARAAQREVVKAVRR